MSEYVATVKEILNSDNYEYAFPCTYTRTEVQDGEPVTVEYPFTVFTDDIFRSVARTVYGKRKYCAYNDFETLLETRIQFKDDFLAWIDRRADMYAGRMFALAQRFNPLENYRSAEIRNETLTHGEKIENSFDNRKDIRKDDSSVERSYTNYKETTKDDTFTERSYTQYKETNTLGEQTITHNISADDDSNFSPQSEDINGEREDTREYEGSYKDQNGYNQLGNEKSISGTYKDQKGFTDGDVLEKVGKDIVQHTGDDVTNYTLERYGNIGVTTSQQMLASDLDLLKYDIALEAIKEFMDQYTYVSVEVE